MDAYRTHACDWILSEEERLATEFSRRGEIPKPQDLYFEAAAALALPLLLALAASLFLSMAAIPGH